LQSIRHAECDEELLVEGRHPLLVDGPVQDAARTQHAPTEEERAGQLVVVDVLQEDQNHGVPSAFNDLVLYMLGLKPEQGPETRSKRQL